MKEGEKKMIGNCLGAMWRRNSYTSFFLYIVHDIKLNEGYHEFDIESSFCWSSHDSIDELVDFKKCIKCPN